MQFGVIENRMSGKKIALAFCDGRKNTVINLKIYFRQTMPGKKTGPDDGETEKNDMCHWICHREQIEYWLHVEFDQIKIEYWSV